MQIFLPYKEPLETAKCLDKRRLWKQILEATQVYNLINGTAIKKAWINHPVVKMYKSHPLFLKYYILCLTEYRNGNMENAYKMNDLAIQNIPNFINDDFCNQHKRRLYTKDSEKYKQFENLGKTEENWYIVDNILLKYNNGKLIWHRNCR